MAINKVVYGGRTLLDLSSDTVTASTLLKGYKAHDKKGNVVTGTATIRAVDDGNGNITLQLFPGVTTTSDESGNVVIEA